MEVRSILRSPFVYETFQRVVGGSKMRSECLKVLAPKEGQRILDVGCGPAYYLAEMPPVEYHGFDTDEVYIAHARKKFGHRGTFYAEPYTEQWLGRLGTFDGILLMGLLHHMDDPSCHTLLSLLARALRPGGRIVALDTVVHYEQSRVERLLAVNDRGKHVRRDSEFASLADKHFEVVDGYIADVPRVPRVHWVMTLSSPRAEAVK